MAKDRVKATNRKDTPDISDPSSGRAAGYKAVSKTFREGVDFPVSYNQTYVTLMSRDPYWLHAYWEITSAAKEDMRRKLPCPIEQCAYTLRMYDVTCVDFNGSNANRWFDIDVGESTQNWYINLWNDNVSYCAEVGLRAPEGQFYPFARSNFSQTPKADSSGRSDMIWMEVPADREKYAYARTEGRPARKAAKPAPASAPHSRAQRRIRLTDDDIRAYYSKLFPLFRVLQRRRRMAQDPASAGDPAFWRLTAKDLALLGDEIRLEDARLPGFVKSRFFKRSGTGASEERSREEGGSEQIFSGASQHEAKKRKFFFEIGTELIVYGRTEPDAEVRLGDQRVQLREDGTFSMRFALPDGRIPLDFTARSADRVDLRRIRTAVERERTTNSP